MDWETSMASASTDAALQAGQPEQLLRDACPPGAAVGSGGKHPAPPRSLGFVPIQGLPTPAPTPASMANTRVQLTGLNPPH